MDSSFHVYASCSPPAACFIVASEQRFLKAVALWLLKSGDKWISGLFSMQMTFKWIWTVLTSCFHLQVTVNKRSRSWIACIVQVVLSTNDTWTKTPIALRFTQIPEMHPHYHHHTAVLPKVAAKHIRCGRVPRGLGQLLFSVSTEGLLTSCQCTAVI